MVAVCGPVSAVVLSVWGDAGGGVVGVSGMRTLGNTVDGVAAVVVPTGAPRC